MTRNRIHNVKILPLALDTKDGDSSLVMAPLSTGNSLCAAGYVRKVKTISMPTLLMEISEKEIDIVKMDIEGAEFPVISSLGKNVFNRVRQWIVECHRKGAEQKQIQQIFEDNGYRVKWFLENNNGLTDHVYAIKC
jgi:FkbM family methyltransferase